MGQVFWLPSSGSAPVSPTPDAEWEHQSGNSRPLNRTRGTSALTTLAYNPDGADDLVNKDSLVCQFVSEILPPQTVAAQLVFLQALCLEAAASNNLQLTWKLYGVNVAGDSVLGTLLAIGRNGVEIGTSLTGAASSRTSSAVTFNEPWRLVLEVGLGGTPTNSATDTHNGSIQFGEAPASATVPTFPQHADTTTGGPPTLIFSNDLVTNFGADGAALQIGL